MDYKEQLTGYLSSCDGKACDVFYEIYSIIGSLKAIEQPLAVRFMCENVFKIDSDYFERVMLRESNGMNKGELYELCHQRGALRKAEGRRSKL